MVKIINSNFRYDCQKIIINWLAISSTITICLNRLIKTAFLVYSNSK